MRPPRISFEGGVYHVTTRCNDQEFLFENSEDFQLFLKILIINKIKYNVEVYSYSLMNNHVHLVLSTPKENNLSKFMQQLNGGFAKAYNKKHGRTGHFWGDRFHSTVIESDTQFFNTILYVESNPIRAGLIKDLAEWEWSSYAANAYGKQNPILDKHSLYLALGTTPEARQEAYRKMSESRLEEKGYKHVLSKGLIVGSENFVRNLIQKLGEKSKFYRDRRVFEFKPGCFSLYKTK